MGWIKLIIFAVVIIGWIVGNLREKSKGSATRNGESPPPLPPVEDDVGPSPRRNDDLQDFLDQIRRRKQAAEEQPMQAVLVEERPRPVPTPRVEPAQFRRRAEIPPPPRQVPLPREPTFRPPPALPPPLTAIPLTSAAIETAPTVSRRNAPTKAVQNVLSLFHDRDSVATAFLLRELLDEPLAKRRRRRSG